MDNDDYPDWVNDNDEWLRADFIEERNLSGVPERLLDEYEEYCSEEFDNANMGDYCNYFEDR